MKALHKALFAVTFSVFALSLQAMEDSLPKGSNALHKAAFEGNLQEVQRLIKSGADINKKTDNCFTVLHLAVIGKNLEVVKCVSEALLKETFLSKVLTLFKKETPSTSPLDTRNSYDETPLMYAAERGYDEMVSFFIEKGADVNIVSRNSKTALYYTITKKHFSTIKLLIENGAKVRLPDCTCGAIFYSVTSGSYEITKYLIGKNANVNETYDEYVNSPIHEAALLGYSKIMNLLLQNGADPRNLGSNSFKATTLHIASDKKHMDCIKMLLYRAPDLLEVTRDEYDGATALHLAASQVFDAKLHRRKEYTSEHLEIFKFLVWCGANINKKQGGRIRSRETDTPLELLYKSSPKHHEEFLTWYEKNKHKCGTHNIAIYYYFNSPEEPSEKSFTGKMKKTREKAKYADIVIRTKQYDEEDEVEEEGELD